MAFDVYQAVTDRIAAQLEKGVGEWRMPWHGEGLRLPFNLASGKHYRGINVPVLWIASEQAGYSSPVWATYKQWSERSCQVRKGEKSTTVVLWKEYHKEASDEDDGRRFVARAFWVFNAAQVDGFAPVGVSEPTGLNDDERIAVAEQFFGGLGAHIEHGGNRAFYAPSRDQIRMPPFARFHDAGAYYATLGHEHIHWTGAKHRLDREFGKRFGDNAYAFEELVAEWGAAFLMANLGLANEPRADHACYLQNWLSILKSDKRALFTAAGRAQAAVDWLLTQDRHSCWRGAAQ